jgi:hypothetical protein
MIGRIISENRRRLIESHVFFTVYNYLHLFPSTKEELIENLPVDREVIETALSDGVSMGWMIESNGVYYAIPLPLLPMGVISLFVRVMRGWRKNLKR